jgi:hypothetical protein
MNWVTIIWSMIASVSFTLATIYLLIWFRERRSWAYLCFFVLAVGVIGLATGEMAAMYAKSPAAYGTAVRWSHFAYGFVAAGSLGFVHFYFGTGKGWLFGAALGLRLLAVVMNFSTGLNLHIRSIQSLQQVNFLGEPVLHARRVDAQSVGAARAVRGARAVCICGGCFPPAVAHRLA